LGAAEVVVVLVEDSDDDAGAAVVVDPDDEEPSLLEEWPSGDEAETHVLEASSHLVFSPQIESVLTHSDPS